MKKIVSLVLAVAVVLAMLTACGQSKADDSAASETSDNSSESAAFDPSALKTMKDAYAFYNSADDCSQESFTEEKYVLVFKVDDVYYRVTTDMPKDVSEAVWAIEFDDEEKDRKIKDLISPLGIASVENLSEQIPSQEELDKYVGKKGQDLFDEGWSYTYYNLDDMEANLNYGAFSYKVQFDYDGEPMENTDDFDFNEAFKDLTVSSVTFEGLGDASGL